MERLTERKTVVVTGASSGIGRAIALAFGREGWRVAVHCRESLAGARAVAAAIAEADGESRVLQADVSDPGAVARLAEEARAAWGRIDVWVNNAGADILTGSAPAKSPLERLQMLLQTDVTGTFLCCQAVAPILRAQGEGLIINMAWDHVVHGMAGIEAELYAAAKGAVWAYSKSLARSLAPTVRVNVLAPGWIKTRFGAEMAESTARRIAQSAPLERWGTPEDVAGVALFLASPAARFITGQTFAVNGGVVMI
ncbi:MAG TPA: SDR family oxidoreductase [Symbiobacteriaceae bacterium]|nr:SDR family oxidoreductase [Symbiobacteriaceae bacterium]